MSERSGDGATSNFLTVLWRHKLLIMIGTVLGLGLGLGTAMLQPTVYTAESRVFLSSQSGFDARSDGPYSTDPSRYLDQQAAILTSSPLLARSLALGAPATDVQELKDSVKVVASAQSDVLTVTATADQPTSATSRVDATIAAYREYQKAQVATQLAAVDSLSTAAEKRAASQRAVIFGDGVELVEDASVTSTTSAIRNATVLAVAGALISSALAFALNARRRRGQVSSTAPATAVDHDDLPAGSPTTASPQAASQPAELKAPSFTS